ALSTVSCSATVQTRTRFVVVSAPWIDTQEQCIPPDPTPALSCVTVSLPPPLPTPALSRTMLMLFESVHFRLFLAFRAVSAGVVGIHRHRRFPSFKCLGFGDCD